MTYTADSLIHGGGLVPPNIAGAIDAWYRARGPAMATQYAPDRTYREPPVIGPVIVALCAEAERAANRPMNPVIIAAQIAKESAFWQSRIVREKNNPSGLGAVNADPLGGAVTFPTPEAGIRATVAHLMTYTIGVDNPWWRDDPRASAVPARNLGAVRTLGDLDGKWAYPGVGYGAGIARLANELSDYAERMAPMSMRAVTDRTIARLRERGHQVIDHRGALPANPRGYRYGPVGGGLSGVRYLIHHWTGDRFTRDTLRTITGNPEYPADVITADMSVDDERALVRWYHTYHQGLDGGVWPGLAYGALVFPSGRIHWAWDIGTLTYHAFDANAVSFATSCPNANGAQPTQQQLRALAALWGVLCHETPEIPAGHGQLYGHREATFLDSRNQTACPGTFLPAVQEFRATGTLAVAAPPPPPVREFPETGHVVGHGFLWYWEKHGALPVFGFPITDEFQENGLTVQYFERARLEWHPDDGHGQADDWHVVRGRVGAELLEARQRIAELEAEVARLRGAA